MQYGFTISCGRQVFKSLGVNIICQTNLPQESYMRRFLVKTREGRYQLRHRLHSSYLLNELNCTGSRDSYSACVEDIKRN